MPKFIEPLEAVNYIKDGATVFLSGFGLAGMAEEMAIAVEKSFLDTGKPNNLTIYASATLGNYGDRGAAHYAHEGLLKRYVTGHFGGNGPALQKLIIENKIEAYNLPQGILAKMPRNIACKSPGVFTKVGLHTFVDPRLEGGKANSVTTEDI